MRGKGCREAKFLGRPGCVDEAMTDRGRGRVVEPFARALRSGGWWEMEAGERGANVERGLRPGSCGGGGSFSFVFALRFRASRSAGALAHTQRACASPQSLAPRPRCLDLRRVRWRWRRGHRRFSPPRPPLRPLSPHARGPGTGGRCVFWAWGRALSPPTPPGKTPARGSSAPKPRASGRAWGLVRVGAGPGDGDDAAAAPLPATPRAARRTCPWRGEIGCGGDAQAVERARTPATPARTCAMWCTRGARRDAGGGSGGGALFSLLSSPRSPGPRVSERSQPRPTRDGRRRHVPRQRSCRPPRGKGARRHAGRRASSPAERSMAMVMVGRGGEVAACGARRAGAGAGAGGFWRGWFVVPLPEGGRGARWRWGGAGRAEGGVAARRTSREESEVFGAASGGAELGGFDFRLSTFVAAGGAVADVVLREVKQGGVGAVHDEDVTAGAFALHGLEAAKDAAVPHGQPVLLFSAPRRVVDAGLERTKRRRDAGGVLVTVFGAPRVELGPAARRRWPCWPRWPGRTRGGPFCGSGRRARVVA